MAFIFSRLSATDPAAGSMASSPLSEVGAAAIMAEEDGDSPLEGSLETTSSSFLMEELSKSDILSLDSLRWDSLSIS